MGIMALSLIMGSAGFISSAGGLRIIGHGLEVFEKGMALTSDHAQGPKVSRNLPMIGRGCSVSWKFAGSIIQGLLNWIMRIMSRFWDM